MKRIVLVWMVAVAILLASCAPAVVSPITDPIATSTVSGTIETDARPANEYAWLPEYKDALSYEEYFSAKRSFSSSASCYVNQWEIGDGTTDDVEKYALGLDEYGFFIVRLHGEGYPAFVKGNRHLDRKQLVWQLGSDPFPVVWEVPGSQDLGQIDAYLTDGAYAYCVRNESEIISVDLVTGAVKTLVSGVSIPTGNLDCMGLYDQTLLYLTRHQDKIHINRLYLPEMIHDVLYEDISADEFLCEFQLGYMENNDTLFWRILDKEMIPLVLEILGDPDSDYRKYFTNPDALWGLTDIAAIGAHEEFMGLVQLIEIHQEKPALIYCFYHISEDQLEQESRYWGH